MKLIVGLGNPGARYRGTYHNIGFEVVDELAERHRAPFGSAPGEALAARVRALGHDVLLMKPLTFMNLSGGAVAALARFYKVEPADLLIVLDEVNLPLGRLRVRARGSAGGHNGLQSVIDALGTQEVARVRVGVGRGDPRRDLASHVLARMSPEEAGVLREAVKRAADAADTFVAAGIEEAMNRFNSKGPGQGGEDS